MFIANSSNKILGWRLSAVCETLRKGLVAGIDRGVNGLFKSEKTAFSCYKRAVFQQFSTSLDTTRCSGCYFLRKCHFFR